MQRLNLMKTVVDLQKCGRAMEEEHKEEEKEQFCSWFQALRW
jgi:hypothetical protein